MWVTLRVVCSMPRTPVEHVAYFIYLSISHLIYIYTFLHQMQDTKKCDVTSFSQS
jgi:hypothetical protein